MTATRLEIKEHEPGKISKPKVIVGVPEAGLVGTISSTYLIQQEARKGDLSLSKFFRLILRLPTEIMNAIR